MENIANITAISIISSRPTTNMSTNSTYRDDFVGEPISSATRIVFIVIGIIYTLMGVLGNLLIILTVITTKTMRNPHYYFIVNLAIADILITGYVIPHLVLSLILRVYPVMDFTYCIVNGITTVVAFVASLLTLMTISINRYLSVCHHEVFNRLYHNNVLSSVTGCVLIWVVSFLTTLPCLVGWGRFKFDKKTHYCGYDRTFSFSYTMFLMLFSIATPVCVIFITNLAIWRYVRTASHKIYAMTHHTTSDVGEPGPSGSSRSKPEHKIITQHGSDVRTSTTRVKKNQITPALLVGSKPRSTPANTVESHKTDTQLVRKERQLLAQGGKPESLGKIQESHSKEKHVLITPGELALMKTIFTIFLTFAVFMTPYMMSTLLDTEDEWPPLAHIVCSFTSFTNACLNCILYGLMTPAFKKAYKNILPCLEFHFLHHHSSHHHHHFHHDPHHLRHHPNMNQQQPPAQTNKTTHHQKKEDNSVSNERPSAGFKPRPPTITTSP